MARSPLYDIYDPYGSNSLYLPYEDGTDMEPLGIIPFGKPRIEDLLPPERKKSMLTDLANAGSSGLSGLGWLLDTPGAMVRGGLSGGVGKALSALYESSDDRVTGRELGRQYGLVGDKDTWGNFFGGLASEVLLDPLTYASAGLSGLLSPARTVAGKAMTKAGLLDNALNKAAIADDFAGKRQWMRASTPRSVIESLPPGEQGAAWKAFTTGLGKQGADISTFADDALSATNRVDLPWKSMGARDLYGQAAGDFLAKTGDRLGEAISGAPILGDAVRGASKLFNPAVLGFLKADRQREARVLNQSREAADVLRREGLAADQIALLSNKLPDVPPADYSRYLQNELTAPEDFYDTATGRSLQPSASNMPSEYGLTDLDAYGRPVLDDRLRALQAAFGPGSKAPQADFVAKFRLDRERMLKELQDLGAPARRAESAQGATFLPMQQVGFDTPRPRVRQPGDPNYVPPRARTAEKVASVSNMDAGRQAYLDVPGTYDTVNQMSMDADLQDTIFASAPSEYADVFTSWLRRRDPSFPTDAGLYDNVLDKAEKSGKLPPLPASHPINKELDSLSALEKSGTQLSPEQLERVDLLTAASNTERRSLKEEDLYKQLGNFLNNLDTQYASKGVPVFGEHPAAAIANYTMSQGRAVDNAKFLTERLKNWRLNEASNMRPGAQVYTAEEALAKLGFDPQTAPAVMAREFGVPDLSEVSFPKEMIDDYAANVPVATVKPKDAGPLAQAYDRVTKSFKTLALAFPSTKVRDRYSGMFASAQKGIFSPESRRAGELIGGGNYEAAAKLMQKNVPEYANLTTEEAVQRLKVEMGGRFGASSNIMEETGSGARGVDMQEMFPGASEPSWADIGQNFKENWRSIPNLAAVRSMTGRNPNPLLDLADRAQSSGDAANRFGAYLASRVQGNAPIEAKRLSDLTQVNYSPEAFTAFDRKLKTLFPFYSYTKGIAPLVVDEILNNPTGLMGKSIRGIDSGSRPAEGSFVPEYLRQSASISVPSGIPFLSLPEGSGQSRKLANIDLPYEGLVNLFSPGTGLTAMDRTGSAVQKTAMNVLGALNPLIKGPLEMLSNRQFYSGRQLSDTYSTLEQTLGTPGRLAEQVLQNTPGGTKALSWWRQYADARIPEAQRFPVKASKFLVNEFTGLKFHDIDEERTKQLAARDMLTQMLKTTHGVRTYENLTVPEDVMRKMPEQQRQLYLLYKVIQSEAARRAREKKKAAAATNPMQLLDFVENR